jgi:hypothetical protein
MFRVIGGPDFRLRLIEGDGAVKEMPLAKWYDQMMDGFSLNPIEQQGWPIDNISHPDENLYLFSPLQLALAAADAPIFQDTKAPPTPPDDAPMPMGMRPLGPGKLYFTSRRLLCIFINGLMLDQPWKSLRSADTVFDMIFNASFEDVRYGFVPKGQSVLRLLAYAHLIAKIIEADTGRSIYLGYI